MTLRGKYVLVTLVDNVFINCAEVNGEKEDTPKRQSVEKSSHMRIKNWKSEI